MATTKLRAIPPGGYGAQGTIAPRTEALPVPLAGRDGDFACGRCGILLLRGTGTPIGAEVALAPRSAGLPIPLLRCPSCGWDNELP